MHLENHTKRHSFRGILITATSILVAGSGLIWLGFRMGQNIIFTLGHTTIMAGGLWLICRSYVNYLWRRYPWESKPVIHAVLEVAGTGIFAALYTVLFYNIEMWLGLFERSENNLLLQSLGTVGITYLVTGALEMYNFYKQWMHHFSKSARLERDNIEAKYETLKTQVNPHFLFNSLNSLTNIVDENPEAVDYIQHLSEFLRYMLQSRDGELVHLRDELKVLTHYMELQKSRFRENLRFRLEVPEAYQLYSLPPLSLQMLVENCVKHNVIASEKPLYIHIRADHERITVSNNLQKKAGVESTGQGLRNIVERYRYFTKKEVEILESKDEFKVSIPLLKGEL